MLGDGIAQTSPEALYRVSAAAASRGEGYKALHFARLLTRVAPTNAAAWRNRAILAEKLGLADEAAASGAKAENPEAAPAPGPSVLPGRSFAVRTASVADYSAFANLMADDSAAALGAPVLLTVNDHASGLRIPTEEEIEQRGHPFAQAQPLKIIDVPNNAVVVKESSPMSKKIDFASIATGVLAVAGAGYALDQGASLALDTTQLVMTLSDAAGESFKKAANTPSKFSGGSVVVTKTDDGGKWIEEKRKPQTTGEVDVVGLPMPVLWASGGSNRGTVTVELSYNAVLKEDPTPPSVLASNAAEPARVSKKMTDIKVQAPRIETLCAGSRCWTGSANEFMLRGEDLAALLGDASKHAETLAKIDAARLEEAFAADPGSIAITQGRRADAFEPIRRRVVAFDDKGSCYAWNVAPDQWVGGMPPPKKKR